MNLKRQCKGLNCIKGSEYFLEFVHLCRTTSTKRFHRQPTPHANLCLNHPSVYGGLLHPPRFVEELILPCDSIPVVKALSRMLPQLFRPDPAMSGSNQGIIIGQDFILLTHRDIPPQQLPHPPTHHPPTLHSTAVCQGLRWINAFQISFRATGVKARRPDGLERESKVDRLRRRQRGVK